MTFFLSVCLLVTVFFVLSVCPPAPPVRCADGDKSCGMMSLEISIVTRSNFNMQIIGCDHLIAEKNYNFIWGSSFKVWPNCPRKYLGIGIIHVACLKNNESIPIWQGIQKRNKYSVVLPNKNVFTFINEQNVNSLIRFDECWWFDGSERPTSCTNTASEFCSVANVNDTMQRLIFGGSYAYSIDSSITLLNRNYVGWYSYKSCEKGTWLTCENSIEGCWYTIPVEQPDETWDWKKNEFYQIHYVNPREYSKEDNLKYIPFGHCYPCDASIARLHYAKYPKCLDVYKQPDERCSINVLITDKDKIVCKGGQFPPLLCPANSRSNEEYTECVCEDGKYMYNGGCQPCPVAHYCIAGVKYRCPDHTYQDNEGGSSCWPCNYENIKIGCALNFLPAKCTFENDPVNLLYLSKVMCVSCSQCRNNVINVAKSRAGESPVYVDCYDP